MGKWIQSKGYRIFLKGFSCSEMNQVMNHAMKEFEHVMSPLQKKQTKIYWKKGGPARCMNAYE